MPTACLLDISDRRDGTGVVLWVKDRRTGTVTSEPVDYRPPILIDGPRALLERVRKDLAASERILEVDWTTLSPSLFDRRPRRLLSVVARRNFDRRRIAAEVDRVGDYHRLTLYDVDLSAPQLFHLMHGVYPFAPVVREGGRWVATERAETVDFEFPTLKSAMLQVTLQGYRRGGIAPGDPPIGEVRLGDATLAGPERDLFVELMRELSRQEPDVLLTDGGDGFDVPRLYHRAQLNGLSDEQFYLGRESASFRPTRPARSFETYGQVLHRDAAFPLPGRFHIDREDSFLYGDAAVEGLVDAARLSRLSLQTVARQSPGTCFTAMEMAHALEDGVHIPWKKNEPERFKSARRLVEADRGGVIFLPPVGVHDLVDEFDFASLFPHIMVRKNLSTETLDCRCCPKSPLVVPGLGYRSCTKRIGLIPRTLEPLITRRLALKARMKDKGLSSEERERARRRVKMLKWILVTSFGYQGYRNARFGRIECHESINAYARELIADLLPCAEESGYRVLHGLVDSLWLTPIDRTKVPDAEDFARRMSRRFDMPLGYEGRYRWVVFLPAVTHGLGVPNRYYGLYESGEFKLRGIGLRRHDTPTLVRRFETEILNALSRAKDAPGVLEALPKVLARADLFAREVNHGGWPREELLISHRIGQDPDAFVTFTDSVAAIRQLQALGASRSAGETVRYLVRDRRSRSLRDRVKVAEALEGDESYDPGAYLTLLARSGATLLAPLGVSEAGLLERWQVAPPPERGRYHSPERMGQRRLEPEGASAGA
ncbi:MAG: DNA polymerase domain-containing protein [Candidatus Lutacidiplasmatales archaeon]